MAAGLKLIGQANVGDGLPGGGVVQRNEVEESALVRRGRYG